MAKKKPDADSEVQPSSDERFAPPPLGSGEWTRIPAIANPAIAQAFQAVREGYEPDRVLVDPVLYKAFIKGVRRAGIDAPEPLVNRRLQGFRKSKIYRVNLPPSTRDAGIDPEPVLYAAELAFARLNQQGHVSVDELITDPAVGGAFVALCKRIAPGGDGMTFKWAALRLRKSRNLPAKTARRLRAVQGADRRALERDRHAGPPLAWPRSGRLSLASFR